LERRVGTNPIFSFK